MSPTKQYKQKAYHSLTDLTADFVDIPSTRSSLTRTSSGNSARARISRTSVIFWRISGRSGTARITKAAYLCFAKRNHLFSNAVIKIARFDGNSVTKFLDKKNIDTNLIRAVDEVLEFVKKHIDQATIRHRNGNKELKWDYPLDALREAIVNAVLHRDYTDTGNIQVRIFEDWLEIWSPGSLPEELDLSRILFEDRAILKNSNLAMIFQSLGLVDNWGTGFKRMNDACVNNGNPEPLYSQKAGAFVVTIHKSIITASIEKHPH
ncbi:MAG: ATP-binding protein [Candidatus Marinimicrobia bacterium]|nr:ATP-binding protein [Candidatus Neomarinimicrobiota bacterium]